MSIESLLNNQYIMSLLDLHTSNSVLPNYCQVYSTDGELNAFTCLNETTQLKQYVVDCSGYSSILVQVSINLENSGATSGGMSLVVVNGSTYNFGMYMGNATAFNPSFSQLIDCGGAQSLTFNLTCTNNSNAGSITFDPAHQYYCMTIFRIK